MRDEGGKDSSSLDVPSKERLESAKPIHESSMDHTVDIQWRLKEVKNAKHRALTRSSSRNFTEVLTHHLPILEDR